MQMCQFWKNFESGIEILVLKFLVQGKVYAYNF